MPSLNSKLLQKVRKSEYLIMYLFSYLIRVYPVLKNILILRQRLSSSRRRKKNRTLGNLRPTERCWQHRFLFSFFLMGYMLVMLILIPVKLKFTLGPTSKKKIDRGHIFFSKNYAPCDLFWLYDNWFLLRMT